jgi:ABC-type uncharacterized transport system substrate-binding protein
LLAFGVQRTHDRRSEAQEVSFVAKGAFASHSVSFHEVGRLSAKHVQRIHTGVKPEDLPSDIDTGEDFYYV